MINKLPLVAFTLLLAAFCLSSCEQERDPCLQPTAIYLRLHTLKNIADTTTADTLLPNPRWIAIDSQITLVFSKNTAAFSLPLNPNADSATYALQPDSALASFDTITFYYQKRLQFLSNACGYTYHYTLQNIKSTLRNIDSVRLRNNDVNGNANTPDHVQVFL